MSEFTKGPLYVYERGGFDDFIATKGGHRVAAFNYNSGITRTEAEANAHLFVAAPELLEALEGLVEASEDVGNAGHYIACLHDARLAIEKARGGQS